MVKAKGPVIVLICLGLGVAALSLHAGELSAQAVKAYEGEIELPSYEFSGRELEPPLFEVSTVPGKYPLPAFLKPYKPGGPKPAAYKAVFLENEYLKLTFVPEFGGRIYSLYDKVNGKEVFYKNDVLKFSGVNPKQAWPVGNIELTGPYDTHTMTLNGEPLWFYKILRHEDGSASLVMSNIDPIFRMKVNFIARLVPGLSAMELKVFCYNRRDSRQPYMFWVNAGIPTAESTRFIYPMTRTIGHTTSEVADWPFYNGVDYSWFKNNSHMLGVFGIDIYDNFLGAYDYKKDYGTFRFADRRVVQGMKTWTYGSGKYAERIESGYTDKAGPYIEIQSGRYVWDGHYEWLDPHFYEGWSEWWFPVAGIGGLTTTSRDAALNLEVQADPQVKNSRIRIGLSANRPMPKAGIILTAGKRVLLKTEAGLAPGKPFNRVISGIAADSAGLTGMRLTVTDSSGQAVLDYRRPDTNPGRREYTSFTSQLEKPRKEPSEMSVEELVLEAETRIKEMHEATGASYLRLALSRDSGNSRAHLNLGIMHYVQGNPDSALTHLEQAIDRDPYCDQAYYYRALALMEQGDTASAERGLYLIGKTSAFYSAREYLLGRISFLRKDLAGAESHLLESSLANGYNLSAYSLLAGIYRLEGRKEEALARISAVEKIDPADRWAVAERCFLFGREEDRRELLSLLGGQSQEALELAGDYCSLCRWDEALAVLAMVEENNGDPYGTPSVFYYTKALCLKLSGKDEEAAVYCQKGRRAGKNLDRFPFRPESIEPFARAIIFDPTDEVARFQLGCLLYFLGRKEEAIYHWERGVEGSPDNFSLQRNLGLAYYENSRGIDKAAEHLEAAIKLNPDHIRTFTDLSYIYSREGYFDRQLTLLDEALQRYPDDDNIIEGLITTSLVKGDYTRADSLISSHEFTQRHRNYVLRDKYRFLRYAMGARAYYRGDYEGALRQFELTVNLPGSLGADDFQFESAPRLYYYIGVTQEKLGKTAKAREAFERSARGWQQLTGDWDSWNSENFYMALSLEKLGEKNEAERLIGSMKSFSLSHLEYNYRDYRSQAHYLLALVMKREKNYAEAERLLRLAVDIQPDNLGPRFELRGDVVDPIPGVIRSGSH